MITGIIVQVLDFSEPKDKFTIQDRIVGDKFILENPLDVLYTTSFSIWQSRDHECFVRGLVFSCTYAEDPELLPSIEQPLNRIRQLNHDFKQLPNDQQRGVFCMCQFNLEVALPSQEAGSMQQTAIKYVIPSKLTPDICENMSDLSKFNFFQIIYYSKGIFQKVADMYNNTKGTVHFADIMCDSGLQQFLINYKALYGCIPGQEDLEDEEY